MMFIHFGCELFGGHSMEGRGADFACLTRRKLALKQALGPEWEKNFLVRSEDAYMTMNNALSTLVLSRLSVPCRAQSSF